MRREILTLALLCITLDISAQEYGQTSIITIWNNNSARRSNGFTQPEQEPDKDQIWAVSEAKLYLFNADKDKATGQAVVICTSDAYSFMPMDEEGCRMAQWFAANGITAAVLKYRMPNGNPEVPLEDVTQALRIMSGLEAGATGFTADKVGLVGFSTEGCLTAISSTLGTDQPAFTILFDPVTSSGPKIWHEGSFRALTREAQWQTAMLEWMKNLK